MGNVHMEATQINYREGDKKMSVAQAIKNAGNAGLAHTADIAPEFSTESAYNAGDFVYYNGSLYEFTANHAAGAWSTDDTQAVTVGGEITSLMSGLTELENHNLDSNVIDITSYISGNTYTTPSDGFVRVSASTEAINVIRKNGVQFCILTGTGTSELSVFVKKGTQLIVDNPSTAKFLPYVN